MSAHERERLSAYLDGELPAPERAEVVAHVAACEECARLLAEMGAADAAARALPTEAPAGYFDAFPSRLRARLEAEGATARRAAAPPRRVALSGRWRLPAWTWAAAAALLLAVVAPLTLRRAPLLPPSVRSPAVQEPAARPARPVAPTPAVEGLPKPRAVPSTTPGRAVSPDAAGRQRSARAEADAVRRDEPAPAEKQGKAGGRAATANQAVVADSVAGEELAAPARQLGVEPGAAFAPAPAAAPAESRNGRSDTFAATPRAGSAAGALTAARGPAPEGTLAEAKSADAGSSADRAFARLAADTPRDASGWRARREAWRAFVAAYPESLLDDEARVRVIEAGLSAWRAGADPADLARAREDARAYLARKDAAQAARVEGLLAAAGEP